MKGLLIDYARVSPDGQDLTAQREALAALGVGADRVCVDHGLTGRNRERPELRRDDHRGRGSPGTSGLASRRVVKPYGHADGLSGRGDASSHRTTPRRTA